jgi:hypothetical protein
MFWDAEMRRVAVQIDADRGRPVQRDALNSCRVAHVGIGPEATN